MLAQHSHERVCAARPRGGERDFQPFENPMSLTAPLPNLLWITPQSPPVYGRPPSRRKPLTDTAALALLDDVTVYAVLFPKRAA